MGECEDDWGDGYGWMDEEELANEFGGGRLRKKALWFFQMNGFEMMRVIR